MKRDEATNMARLAVILSRYSDLGFEHHAQVAWDLCRYARTLGGLAELACNRNLRPDEEKREARVRKAIQAALAEDYPRLATMRIEFNGDPRGYAVKFTFPGKESNNWGGNFGIG